MFTPGYAKSFQTMGQPGCRKLTALISKQTTRQAYEMKVDC